MPFLLDLPHFQPGFLEENERRGRQYRDYLVARRTMLADGVFEFATVDWRRDLSHLDTLHDSALDAISVGTVRDASGNEQATVSLKLRSRFDDKTFAIDYGGVNQYCLDAASGCGESEPVDVADGHGTFVIDEFQLVDGVTEHQVIFTSGAKFAVRVTRFRFSIERR